MQKLPIKAAAIRNLTDARYFAAWITDWMSFPMDEVSPGEYAAMCEWVEGPRMAGEFGHLPVEEVLAICRETGLEGVQVGTFFDPENLDALREHFIFQERIIENDTSISELRTWLSVRKAKVHVFLLDFSANGVSWAQLCEKSQPFSWKDLQSLCHEYPIWLDIPVAPQDLSEMVETLQPAGLNLKGGEEEKVGYKSFEDLDAYFEVLEEVSF